MTKMSFEDGLLYTSVKIYYRGRVKIIDKMVVDTGASHSIISTDVLEEIGISIEDHDEIIINVGIGGKQFSVIKQVDGVEFNGFKINNCKIDIGEIHFGGTINGLLGLDLLMEAGVILDLKNLRMFEAL